MYQSVWLILVRGVIAPSVYDFRNIYIWQILTAVSYTHLDVYKRQPVNFVMIWIWYKIFATPCVKNPWHDLVRHLAAQLCRLFIPQRIIFHCQVKISIKFIPWSMFWKQFDMNTGIQTIKTIVFFQLHVMRKICF